MRPLLVLLFLVYCLHLLTEQDPELKQVVNRLQGSVQEDIEELGHSVGITENSKRVWNDRRKRYYYVNNDPVLHYDIRLTELVNTFANNGCLSKSEATHINMEANALILKYYDDTLDPQTLRYTHVATMNDSILRQFENEVSQISVPIEEKCGLANTGVVVREWGE